ncbi:MAG TPA: hypothetical protein PKE12_06285 [Kiritimatiellia bacterium]|nr:hypothetical protein [Kiritimatiellia bacterium]
MRISVLMLMTLTAATIAQAQRSLPFCQFLDGAEAPSWEAHVSHTTDARVEAPEGRDVAIWSVGGGGGLYYWRTGSGELDLTGAYDLRAFDGSGGIALPDYAAALRLNAAFVMRNWDGSALRITAMPGIYSDLEDISFEDLGLPVEVAGIQAFNPQVSGLIGVALYPGFIRAFDPRFGIRYAPDETLRVDLMYPESRVIFRPAAVELYAGLRHDAVNEFRLEEDDSRRRMALRETRAFTGVAWLLNDVLRMSVELGYAFNREVDFDKNAPGRDLEEAWQVRLGIGGAL